MKANTTPEGRLVKMPRENMTLEERLAAARELREKGEKLDVILWICPEYAEESEQLAFLSYANGLARRAWGGLLPGSGSTLSATFWAS